MQVLHSAVNTGISNSVQQRIMVMEALDRAIRNQEGDPFDCWHEGNDAPRDPNDNRLQQLVDRVGQKLLTPLKRIKPDTNYSFKVSDDNLDNSWTNGKTIWITKKLLIELLSIKDQNLTDEEKISGTLAHEIAHCFQNHCEKKKGVLLAINLISEQIVENSIQSPINPNIKKMLVIALCITLLKSQMMISLNHQMEYEADTLGTFLLQTAGYLNPACANFQLRFFEQKLGPETARRETTYHPSLVSRINRNQISLMALPLMLAGAGMAGLGMAKYVMEHLDSKK
jgi:predicted Zn-dependent protease